MLTQIGVEYEGDELIVPILGVTPKESLLIRKITGLNPPDLDLFIGDYSRDGGTYQGRRVGKRNVVITADLNPNPALGETISGLRELLYKVFVDPQVDADFVKVNYYDDLGRVRYSVGYTEKFDTEIFDVETMAMISMICPDPYLRDNTETELTHPTGWTTVPFTYEGTAETGFEVSIYINSATSVLTLDNNGKKMIINRSFDVADVVTINTVRGSRLLTVTPSGGSPISIVANLEPTSPWVELHSQANTMKVYGATTGDLIASIRSLKYTQAYWGI